MAGEEMGALRLNARSSVGRSTEGDTPVDETTDPRMIYTSGNTTCDLVDSCPKWHSIAKTTTRYCETI